MEKNEKSFFVASQVRFFFDTCSDRHKQFFFLGLSTVKGTKRYMKLKLIVFPGWVDWAVWDPKLYCVLSTLQIFKNFAQ